jgi:hypothetical protein
MPMPGMTRLNDGSGNETQTFEGVVRFGGQSGTMAIRGTNGKVAVEAHS